MNQKSQEKQALEQKLKELLERWSLEALAPLPSAGDYVGFVKTPLTPQMALVTISGQVPVENGKLLTGKVGDDIDEAQAIHAARLCAIAILAQVKSACGDDLSRVERCVRLGGFVNAVPGFTRHPEVVNGASEVMGALFGDKGKHARFAVGAASLPRNVPVEVEAQFLILDR